MRRHESFRDGSTNEVRKGFLTAQEMRQQRWIEADGERLPRVNVVASGYLSHTSYITLALFP